MEVTNIQGLTRDQWVERFCSVPNWTLAETLFWIVLGDADRVAECLWLGDEAYFKGGASRISYFVHNAKLPSDWIVRSSPETALQVALHIGSVVANGLYHVSPPRADIPVADWSDLELRDGPRFSADRVCAIPRAGIIHAQMDLTGTWVDVMFGRNSVIATFPATANHHVVAMDLTGSVAEGEALSDGEWKAYEIGQPLTWAQIERGLERLSSDEGGVFSDYALARMIINEGKSSVRRTKAEQTSLYRNMVSRWTNKKRPKAVDLCNKIHAAAREKGLCFSQRRSSE